MKTTPVATPISETYKAESNLSTFSFAKLID
jgi:hypothetical protein